MLPYLLAIPLGLLATGLFGGYLIQGGILRWLMVTNLMSLTVMVHLTAAMVVAPAAALAYLAALIASGAREPRGARSGCGSGRRAHRRGSGHPPALFRRAAYRRLAGSALRAGE